MTTLDKVRTFYTLNYWLMALNVVNAASACTGPVEDEYESLDHLMNVCAEAIANEIEKTYPDRIPTFEEIYRFDTEYSHPYAVIEEDIAKVSSFGKLIVHNSDKLQEMLTWFQIGDNRVKSACDDEIIARCTKEYLR